MRASRTRHGPEESWSRARRHYLRAARRPGGAHLSAMRLVVDYARSRRFDHHFHAYALPDFLAVSTASTPADALTTPFLSISVDEGGFFELTLVSPESSGPVVPVRTPQTHLYQELDTGFAALGELLVAHFQGSSE